MAKTEVQKSARAVVLLSGGLDSTSLAVIARDLVPPGDLQAFTTVYDSLIPDEERRYSTLAAASLGIPIQHLSADRRERFPRRRFRGTADHLACHR